jgi:hypothetical protein
MTPAGATSTEFRVNGHKFSGNSAITFLLDGSAAPGNSVTQSDSNGDITATLPVTGDWPVGDHTLTARDANGYTTKDGVAIKIVPQGQAHTPGPNGAPADDESFTVAGSYSPSGEASQQITLQITGHADPNGGSVCTSADDGSQYTDSGQDNIGQYVDTYTFSCSGTYKGGKLSYTETLTSDKFTYANGVTCTEHAPYTWVHLEGTFTGAGSINGSYKRDTGNYDCTQNASLSYNPLQGNWTGQIKQ